MTDRRRNFFILLLVAGLLAASAAVIATKETRLGLDLKGGVSLVYEGKPTRETQVTPEAMERAIDIIRDRIDTLGVAEPEIARTGEDQIDVSLPGVDNLNEAIDQVGTTAQLFFYDWEKNVLDKDCKPQPSDDQVTGGSVSGQAGSGSLPRYGAIIRAARCPATDQPDDTHDGLFYGVDDKAQQVTCGPQENERELKESCADQDKTYSRAIEVKRGTIVVQAEENPDNENLNDDAYFVLRDNPGLKGTDIKNPEQNFDNSPGGTGQPNVTFEFTDKGKKQWQDVTREIAQRGQQQFLPGSSPAESAQHFAIVLDDELISTPFIDFQQNPDGIDGSTGSEISGGFTIKTAQRLANLLKTGALPLKLELISQSQVSATLGQQALDQGLIAGVGGFVVVALFLLLFYRVLGLIAVGALAVYGLYFYAIIKLIPITLTLPGIAGLILTLGVAADANIVIFERVKEEIRAGRSVAAGLATGYKRGIAAIIDANVVTFMVAFILFMIATAGVKGFAFTLGIGTLTSLFTAVLATQAVLGTMQRTRVISHPRALGAGETDSERWRFDYMGASKWFFSASGMILLVCALAVGSKGLNFGIDFESGTRVKTTLTEKPSVADVQDTLRSAGFADAEVQQVKGDRELKTDGYQISLGETSREVANVRGILEREYGAANAYQAQSVGPTFGQTIAKSALIAIIASLIVISAYLSLRFEWKYSVPVLIAVAHDILITAGIYALLGQEVTASTVAALLTILGFSLYDTIIVFDRIRENVPRMPRAAFSQIINRSMSEVIVRSMATSFCTVLPVFALLVFGGDTLKDFALALIIGTASGTYSSIFIASPVLMHWKERDSVYVRRRRRVMELNNGVVPAYAADPKVELKEQRKASKRLTAPEDPERQVSASEFEELVRDIQHETRAPTATREPDPTADARPEDLVMKDEPKRDKPKRPRNKRHGRSR